MPKKAIREQMLARRKHQAAETCLALSLKIQERFLSTPEYTNAGAIALYSPVFNEVFTEEIFTLACWDGKQVSYPRVRGDLLEFVRVSALTDLAPGAFGILEPTGAGTVSVAELDLLVVPGVAFDAGGFRLGYGKGFYDRVLHRCESRGVLCGLCFDFQRLEALPSETHDIGMDLLITEKHIFRF